MLLLSVSHLLAQDANSVDSLHKELADTKNQLKAAQDRKNELSIENEKLKAQIAASQKELDDAQHKQATSDTQLLVMRMHEAAWTAFLDLYPMLKSQWQIFLEVGSFDPMIAPPYWTDEKLAAPATAPTTTPAAPPATTQSTTDAVMPNATKS